MASVPGIAELNAIRAQVDAVGVMDIHPDAARSCARACSEYLEVLHGLLTRIQQKKIEHGFGPLPSGQALNAKFNDKLNGESNSLRAVLLQHVNAITELRDAFTRVADTVAETEAGNNAAIAGADGPR